MSDMSEIDIRPDIATGRLKAEQYTENFDDLVPVLDRKTALVEANRCYFCYDAPCIEACPTGIDIPGFIKKIATDNVRGSAVRILEANIFGGACARVCPTEILCEQACVRNAQENKPVTIGRLQRYATDHLMATGEHPFTRAPLTGRKVAVVGAGPAGLSCAHRLAMLGHDVVVFEAKAHPGGLNEYGVAEYKMPDHFARAEVDFLLKIGGIEIRTGQALGRDITLSGLRRDYDAVFLGMGLAGVKALEAEGEELAGVMNAVDYIADLRQADDFGRLPVGRKVVVIGGGNTAIDIAIQIRRLGAEDVTLVYRRGPSEMGATHHEQELAQVNGVRIKHWARPVKLTGQGGAVREAVFEYTQLDADGRLIGTGDHFAVPADMVFKAIGQSFVPDPLRQDGRDLLELKGAKIAVDAEGKTSLDKVWAGGDCTPGQDLTVAAVQDGKIAALAIDRALRG
ncbi:MAG: NAD(P)-dependent oxidoreductase [Alphaproteobacteria bacterium]|jgi:glutamate synthase (NADPH/NADH) small chain|nr:NAD(P)-dependent oxidoreductase [Alphaproteobacteria bacterium]